jgi:hypothetical protein
VGSTDTGGEAWDLVRRPRGWAWTRQGQRSLSRLDLLPCHTVSPPSGPGMRMEACGTDRPSQSTPRPEHRPWCAPYGRHHPLRASSAPRMVPSRARSPPHKGPSASGSHAAWLHLPHARPGPAAEAVSKAPAHGPAGRFAHPCSPHGPRVHAALAPGATTRLSCGRLGHMAVGPPPGHDGAKTATAAAFRPRPCKQRPTRRGAIVGTMPRLSTASAHARGVQWRTGRSEAAPGLFGGRCCRGRPLGGGVGPAQTPASDRRVTDPQRLRQVPSPDPLRTLSADRGPLDCVVRSPAAVAHVVQDGALPIRQRNRERARTSWETPLHASDGQR